MLLTGTRAQTTTPIATISSGRIIGRETQSPHSNTTVNQFLGIPFAKPPIDELRFAPPQNPESWTSPLAATEQPSACPQLFGEPGPAANLSQLLFNDPPIGDESEDCLYLDVYVPQGEEPGKPVLFWVHGGSEVIGGVSLPLYDGTDFAANQDVITVVSNYRLGCE